MYSYRDLKSIDINSYMFNNRLSSITDDLSYVSLFFEPKEKPMKPHKNIPLLVRTLRERVGLSQEKFAARLGVTTPTINRWENGRVKPSPLAMKQIENLFKNFGKQDRYLLNEIFEDEKQA